ncbi:MAG: RecQ family ATP-dependent DNA helicase [Parafilimonas sp.]|nr:RecQ family ATP-dependent DNA helicase [Parafilimonas sp.]
MLSPLSILQQYWNHTSFRPQQEAIIQSVLNKKDTIALLPTGGGKSLCYQIPALLNEGLCLVISPLIALMKDQVANLEKRNIDALLLHSGQTFFEVKLTLQNGIHGNYKFLYVSPERLQSNLFKEYLPALNINLIAIDEAHCISQWGYDFRPSYLQIAALKDFVNATLLALTASATPVVLDDIKNKLKLKDADVFRQSFHRSNLSYSVFKVDSKINKAIDVLKNVNGSGIIYCKSRKLVKRVSDLLNLQNIDADFYHAGLKYDERSTKQEAWLNNETRVMVCTNAFGMGIDKPDVRTVIHYDVPDCLESYYQEAGRAGRDEKKSYAVLLYNSEDEIDLKNLPSIRFPEIKEVKKIYQCLVDYLQIPVGIGEGTYYNFNLNEFIKNFSLDVFAVVNTLKILEQENYISFNETVFLPSAVCFITPKELLFDFEQSHPQLEPVIKSLLRTYEGIYDNKVSINEKLIGRLTKMDVNDVKHKLRELQSFNVIEYNEQKDTPQIYFITNRAPAEYLLINYERYKQRKNEFTQRVETMQRYLTSSICRSRIIGNYFGDNEITDCGVCDNCLKKKSTAITEDEFLKIKDHILNLLADENVLVQVILQKSKSIKKDRLWKVLDYLQSEKLIKIESDGRVYKLKPSPP